MLSQFQFHAHLVWYPNATYIHSPRVYVSAAMTFIHMLMKLSVDLAKDIYFNLLIKQLMVFIWDFFCLNRPCIELLSDEAKTMRHRLGQGQLE
jgi:hypothetical protein